MTAVPVTSVATALTVGWHTLQARVPATDLAACIIRQTTKNEKQTPQRALDPVSDGTSQCYVTECSMSLA